ncbi:MAG: ROK family protein, partial [Thermanaerothrix sp.]|nr:ROK family protein [Thermanaerothrix sp.]
AIEKDTSAAALGEYCWGAGRGCEDFVFFGIGSGLGGGIIAHGDLVRGADGNAAEVGHIALDPEQGRLCACGLRGCVETVVSGPGLVAITQRLLANRGYDTRLSAEGDLDAHTVVQAIADGDPLAQAAFNEMAAAFTTLVAFTVGLLNPARIVIGGGLGLAVFEPLCAFLEQELSRRVLAASHRNLQIVPSQLENPALGAACLVWQAHRVQR